MSDLYQVRVQSVRDRYLTCRVTELYEDSGLFPSRTLALHLLWDTVDGRTDVRCVTAGSDVVTLLAPDFARSSPLGQALAGRFAYEDPSWNWKNVSRFLSCVGVVDHRVGTVDVHYLDAGQWFHDHDPDPKLQATFHFAAADPEWFAHLAPGMEWESRALCDDIWERVHPGWRTPDVMLLARGIDDEQAFERMPILADALQDAGCDYDELLNHLRDLHAAHVRGCWALDLILGKG